MRIISYNINGLKACVNNPDRPLQTICEKYSPDILALQETRCSDIKILNSLLSSLGFAHIHYSQYAKPGQAGVAILSHIKPLQIIVPEFGTGRVLAAEYEDCIFVCVYVPNSQGGKMQLRMEWEEKFRKFISELSSTKPVLIGGEMNVSLDNSWNKRTLPFAGGSQEEIDAFARLLTDCCLVDCYRELNRYGRKYTQMIKMKHTTLKWRLDYFLATTSFMEKVKSVDVIEEVWKVDHAPIVCEIV